jgi:hypothetical protein
MFLSINPLLPEISFIVIDGGIVVEKSSLTKNLDTASTLPRHIVDIMNRHVIDEIWCVTGPGPFTLMRIVTLTCNSIRLARWTKLKWWHLFDILDTNYTPIIEANPRECIIRQDDTDRLIPRADIPDWSYTWLLGSWEFTEGKTFIQYKEDVPAIQKAFQNKEHIENLSPIYFKAPHITCSKKKTYPSSETMKTP